MIMPVIISFRSVPFDERKSKMETEQTAQILPTHSHRKLLTLPTILPPDLNGSSGTNRIVGVGCQLAAKNDIEAICVWLAEYRDSPHTLRSYRREVSRLLLWTLEVRRKPLSSLTREDFMLFEAFLSDPGCRISLRRQSVFKPGGRSPSLSVQSRQQAMGILCNLLNYLVSAGYLAANPLALHRGNRRKTQEFRRPERFLDEELWHFVLESIELWPKTTRRQLQHYERSRWTIRFLYQTALRASEAAAAKASDFYLQRGRWWLRVNGKGGDEGNVPISDHLMDDFGRYRRSSGYPSESLYADPNPVIMHIGGPARHHLTATSVYLITKEIFRRASTCRQSADPAGAATLARASTHWIRHTAASHQANAGIDLRFVQENLRHASLQTTSIYLHAQDDQRHARLTGQEATSREERGLC
jgi:integrase/recombinase XerC